jgi:cysteate synthase
MMRLPKLWIAFNGYWPEKNASLCTGSFKELEAYAVLSRAPQAENSKEIVLASAGNTAAAFARVCALNGIPATIIVPQNAIACFKFDCEIPPSIKLLALPEGADYSDAITLATKLSMAPKYYLEGGTKNVAKRDGLAIVLLSAVEIIGQVPDYYFQAIGSGTGAIAVHEASHRLNFQGPHLPKLWLSQNAPFIPVVDAWSKRSTTCELNDSESAEQIDAITAKVLANRKPPYSVKGGLYHVLSTSGAQVVGVTNEEAREAMEIFLETEGIDIDPAAGVAFASLLRACQQCLIADTATVLLNISGGGRKRYAADHRIFTREPDHVLPADFLGFQTRWNY